MPQPPVIAVREQVGMFMRNQRVAAAVPGAAGAPAHRRVLSQLLNHQADGFLDNGMQSLYLQARDADALLTPPVFLARFADNLDVAARGIRMLGEGQFVLATTRAAAEYRAAFERVLRSMRDAVPPFDAVMSYGGWRYRAGMHVERAPGRAPRLVAMDAPVWSKVGDVWFPSAPDWNVGRERGNRLVAFVQLMRAPLGLDLPLDIRGAALFDRLPAIRRSMELTSYLDRELREPPYKTAFMLDTGYSPIFTSRVRAPDPNWIAPERHAREARWELAERHGDGAFIEMTEAELRAARPSPSSLGTPSAVPRDHDVFTLLSEDELFRLALQEKGGPRLTIKTWEWEHHRAQRVHDLLDEIIARLARQARLPELERERIGSVLRYLTGLCDPDNLHLVSRWWHAMEDARAAFRQRADPATGVRGSVWETGDLSQHRFARTPSRRDRFRNQMVPPGIAGHPDADRVINPFVAYDPRQLLELVTFLEEINVPEAAQGLTGQLRRRYNGMVRALNTSITLYNLEVPVLRELP